MKKSSLFFLCLIVLSFSLSLVAQNGLECIVVEKYYVSSVVDTSVNDLGGRLPVGSVTYRIYADMLPGYKFQAAYGVDVAPVGQVGPGDHELILGTSTLFFNNEDRGATTPSFTKARCADNTVMLDSWLSVGAACVGNFGVMKDKDNGVATVVNGDGVLQNNDPSAGIPLTQQDGLLSGSPEAVTEVGLTNIIGMFDNQNDGTNGPLFSTYNGSWACLGGCEGPSPADNILLIAQITTDGIFWYDLNIQIGTPSGGVERYVARNPVGSEILLPCLSDTFGLPANNNPPIVNITNPANGFTAVEGTSISIAADATVVGSTITQVEFFANGTSIAVDNTAPYTANWTLALGSQNLTAKATAANGLETISSVVSVTGLPSGTLAISITNPTSGSSFVSGNTLSIEATASAPVGATITQVNFLVDGISVGQDNTAPYAIDWVVTPGAHTLTASVTDDNGQQVNSQPVQITGTPTSVSEASAQQILIYPSPVATALMIRILDLEGVFNYSLLDLSGRQLFTGEVVSEGGDIRYAIDMSAVSPGTYFMHLTNGKVNKVERIIK